MQYLIHIAIMIAIYGILAVSLNLLVGYTGLVSLAHSAFFSIGAYTTALLMTHYKLNFFLTLPAAILISAVLAWVSGLLLSKFKGDYYVLGTLALATILYAVELNWQELTNGPLGIAGIGRPQFLEVDFNLNINFFVLSGICFLVVYGISHYIVNSSFGRVLKAIREDDEAASVFGYKILNYKLAVFIISAALAAVAGCLYASYITYIDPTGINESIFLLSIVILGGLASLKGSLAGTVALIILPEALRFVGFPTEVAAQMRQLTYGLLLVILMLYRPQGLMGEYKL